MKQLSFLYFLLALLFSNSAFSQSDNIPNNQIKFYFNSFKDGYLENRISNNGEVAKIISKFGTPSIAYVWKTKEKETQEIAFSAFFNRNLDVTLTGTAVTSSFSEKLTYISARYERNRILLGSDKIDMSLGGGFQAAYINNSFRPATSSDFPLSYNGLHTNFSVIPRILVKFNKFALDFNMPYTMARLNTNIFREEVPTLTEPEQSSGNLDLELFPRTYALQVRLGVAVNLK